ncbi:MAG: arginine N-succinyltransferase, partial [Gammaproteobacteria bacterium]|nr:arginine N-succinyltransferase [Gammaproteobacteria bacterium]
SIMGVPLPNAWLGGIKNIDLVREYGDEGFWKAFDAGVEEVSVDEGRLRIVLKK